MILLLPSRVGSQSCQWQCVATVGVMAFPSDRPLAQATVPPRIVEEAAAAFWPMQQAR